LGTPPYSPKLLNGPRRIAALEQQWRRVVKSLLTAATLVIVLAVPAVAQSVKDPGRESPLAAGAGAIQQAQNQDCAGKWKRADVSNKQQGRP
jgi:hypothetical protein